MAGDIARDPENEKYKRISSYIREEVGALVVICNGKSTVGLLVGSLLVGSY